MAKALDPAFFAIVGRQLLIDLDFVPAERKQYWRLYHGTPALAVATELCRTHPIQMTALRERIQSTPKPKAKAVARSPRAAANTAARPDPRPRASVRVAYSASQLTPQEAREMDVAMGVTSMSDGQTYVQGNVLSFGSPALEGPQ